MAPTITDKANPSKTSDSSTVVGKVLSGRVEKRPQVRHELPPPTVTSIGSQLRLGTYFLQLSLDNGDVFWTDKALLGRRIPSLKEQIQGPSASVRAHNVDSATFEVFLEWLYSHSAQEGEGLRAFLKVADMKALRGLIKLERLVEQWKISGLRDGIEGAVKTWVGGNAAQMLDHPRDFLDVYLDARKTQLEWNVVRGVVLLMTEDNSVPHLWDMIDGQQSLAVDIVKLLGWNIRKDQLNLLFFPSTASANGTLPESRFLAAPDR